MSLEFLDRFVAGLSESTRLEDQKYIPMNTIPSRILVFERLSGSTREEGSDPTHIDRTSAPIPRLAPEQQ